MITRSKAKAGLGQPPNPVASPGVNRPRRRLPSQQVRTDVGSQDGHGGSQRQPARDGNDNQDAPNAASWIKTCSKNRCLFCKTLNCSTNFKGQITGKSYEAKKNQDTVWNCKSNNVIYLLTCLKCSAQYVGETHQELHHRFNDHRSRIRNKDKISHTAIMVDHFNGECKDHGYEVQIIEKLDSNSKLPNGRMDPQVAYQRRKREEFWMKELRTVYPYGLNNRCEKNIDQREEDSVYQLFRKKKKNKKRRKRKGSRTAKYPATEIITKIEQNASITETTATLMKFVPQMKKEEILKLETWMETADINNQIRNVLEDLIKIKWKQPKKEKKLEKKFGTPLTVLYHNDAIGMINLSRLMRLRDVQEALPVMDDKDKPNVVFSYTRSIRGQIFNYRKTCETLDTKNWNEDLVTRLYRQ